MGGDKLVAAVAGEAVRAAACGDAVRERKSERFAELIGEVRPLEGARS